MTLSNLLLILVIAVFSFTNLLVLIELVRSRGDKK